ncbi:PEP-CTERM -sorting domain protein [Methyloversatilis sp. RAC08]|nr:PEP-CTERM -sorting domain protein [Methyloversatilis sp. RAC08]
MKVSRTLTGIALAAMASLHSGTASAVLVNNVGLEVRALIDTDAFGGNAPLVNLTESEIDLPYDRSVVNISGGTAGSFSYTADADIGNQLLKIGGSLTNSTGTDMFGFGVPLINVYAQAKDVLTLSSAVAGTYAVTLELVVHGNLETTGVSGEVSANSLLSFGPVVGLNTTDSARYTQQGAIDDTLSVTRQVTFASPGAAIDMEFEAFISFTATRVPAGFTVSGDLSNTAFLNLILPQGLSVVESGSGTFGVPIVPIPEPTINALMLAGLALVGTVARRRKGF